MIDNPSDDLPLTFAEIDHLSDLADQIGHDDQRVALAARTLLLRCEGKSYREIQKETGKSPKFARSICVDFREHGRTACGSLKVRAKT